MTSAARHSRHAQRLIQNIEIVEDVWTNQLTRADRWRLWWMSSRLHAESIPLGVMRNWARWLIALNSRMEAAYAR